MDPQHEERRLTTVLVADVVGYSRLMTTDESGTLAQLKTHRKELIEPKTAEYHGRVVKLIGDGTLMEFASVVDAVNFAVNVQQAMVERNAKVPEDRQIKYRVGINIGDIIVEGDDIYGDGVNVAARLENLAEPDGICISGKVYEEVKHKVELRFEDLGEREVKNIPEPVRVYRVLTEPGAAGAVVGKARGIPRSWMWRSAVAGVAALLAVVGVVIWLRPWAPDVEPASVERMAFPLPDKPSIAVLPFANMSGEAQQEYFADGMAEDIITDLSKISGLFVIARNSSFAYKGTSPDVRAVARELGVRFVLEGSVRKSGKRVRINAQLIDAVSGGHLWAERYDRDLNDIFALQDEITAKIVGALAVKLAKSEQERVARRYTDNMEAYDNFLRGRAYRGGTSKETNAEARRLMERALELDPNFAAAYAELSWIKFVEWFNQFSEEPGLLERSFEAARKAVVLDDTLPMAHANLGWTYMWKKQHEKAIAAAERALVLDRNYAEGYLFLGDILNFAGRPEDSIEVSKKGMRLDPHSMYHYLVHLGLSYYMLGRHEQAIANLKKSAELYPDYLITRLVLAAVYGNLDRKAEAQNVVTHVLRINPRTSIQTHGQPIPFKDPAILERFVNGLRKAGLPE